MALLSLFTIGAFAHGKSEDCVMMQDGKMMVMKGGKTKPMDKDIKMKNGCVCKMDGSMLTKDGKKTMMRNGECMNMDGDMMMMKYGQCFKVKSNKNKSTK